MREFFSEQHKPASPELRDDSFDRIKRALLQKLTAGTVLLGACGVSAPAETVRAQKIEIMDGTPEPVFDEKKILYKFHENGALTPEEIREKTIHLAPGVSITDDAGIFFYHVQKEDKTIEGIRDKLLAFPEFAHLKDQKGLKGFNIFSRHLKPGMLIPIPQLNSEREMTDEEFKEKAREGLHQILEDKLYGPTIKHVLEKDGMSEDVLINSLLAIAKQETGSETIGQFVSYRYEGDNGHNEPSLGFGHVLMQGAGLRARQKLGMTEGQTFDTTNGAKLLLAFLVEKSGPQTTDLWDFFPFTEKNLEKFASFYNGGTWKETNPDYAKNIWKYYKEVAD